MAVKGIVALVLALVMGAVVAAFLAGGGLDDTPSVPVLGTAAGVATSTAVMAAPEASGGTRPAEGGAAAALATQVAGISGCGRPLFVTAGGLPRSTQLRVERIDLAQEFVAFSSKADGTANVDADPLLSSQCTAGSTYTLRIADSSGRVELARVDVAMPLFRGTIEVEPASGGCGEIVVTVRGMPANALVEILAVEPRPFATEGTFVVPRPLETSERGVAQSAPFEPPWACDMPAVSLVAFASVDGQSRTREAELLYRIALQPGEAVPGIERWLFSIAR